MQRPESSEHREYERQKDSEYARIRRNTVEYVPSRALVRKQECPHSPSRAGSRPRPRAEGRRGAPPPAAAEPLGGRAALRSGAAAGRPRSPCLRPAEYDRAVGGERAQYERGGGRIADKFFMIVSDVCESWNRTGCRIEARLVEAEAELENSRRGTDHTQRQVGAHDL